MMHFESAKSPRPRVLIIIQGNDKYFFSASHSYVDHLFKELWRSKFMDFTLMYVPKNQMRLPVIAYYAMFRRSIFTGPWSKNVSVFPDKLKDMNGAKFTVGYISQKELLTDKSTQVKLDGNAILVRGFSQYSPFMTKSFCKIHNCTPDMVVAPKYRRPNFDLLTGRQTYTWEMMNFSTVGYPRHIERFVVAVPQLSQKTKSTSTLKISNIVIFYAALLIQIYVLKILLKVGRNKDNWPAVKILLCLLGSPLKPANNVRSRISYLTLIVLSFYVSNDMIDIATEYKLEVSRQSVNNWTDVFRLNVTVYTNEQTGKFHGNVEFTPNIRNCLDWLIVKNDRACICDEMLLKVIVGHFKRYTDQIKNFRVAKFYVQTCFTTILFTSNCPYVEKYRNMLSYAYDFGILRPNEPREFEKLQNFVFREEDLDIVPADEAEYFWALFLVTVIIYFISGLVMILEVTIYYRLRWKRWIKLVCSKKFKRFRVRHPRFCVRNQNS